MFDMFNQRCTCFSEVHFVLEVLIDWKVKGLFEKYKTQISDYFHY